MRTGAQPARRGGRGVAGDSRGGQALGAGRFARFSMGALYAMLARADTFEWVTPTE